MYLNKKHLYNKTGPIASVYSQTVEFSYQLCVDRIFGSLNSFKQINLLRKVYPLAFFGMVHKCATPISILMLYF